MDTTLLEIASRRRTYGGGTQVTNCIIHAGRAITDRPHDCPRCQTDRDNFINRAVKTNEFLNGLMDEIEEHLAAEIAREALKGTKSV